MYQSGWDQKSRTTRIGLEYGICYWDLLSHDPGSWLSSWHITVATASGAGCVLGVRRAEEGDLARDRGATGLLPLSPHQQLPLQVSHSGALCPQTTLLDIKGIRLLFIAAFQVWHQVSRVAQAGSTVQEIEFQLAKLTQHKLTTKTT